MNNLETDTHKTRAGALDLLSFVRLTFESVVVSALASSVSVRRPGKLLLNSLFECIHVARVCSRKGVYFGKLERGMTFKITTKKEAHLVRVLCGFGSCLGVGHEYWRIGCFMGIGKLMEILIGVNGTL